MKAFAVAFLASWLLCNSTLALTEDTVPFRALMNTAGSLPSKSALDAAQDSSSSS